MKDSLVQQCLDILKREDITVALVFLIFVMILAILIILIMLLRNKLIISKLFNS